VVQELIATKMIRPTAPLADRREEPRWQQEQYGLSEVFGEEVPAIMTEMMEAGQDGAG
jgi:hypothetical protein